MLKRVLKRLIRQPISALSVILFTGVLSVVLCHLHLAEQEEIRSFEETYRSVPGYLNDTFLNSIVSILLIDFFPLIKSLSIFIKSIKSF